MLLPIHQRRWSAQARFAPQSPDIIPSVRDRVPGIWGFGQDHKVSVHRHCDSSNAVLWNVLSWRGVERAIRKNELISGAIAARFGFCRTNPSRVYWSRKNELEFRLLRAGVFGGDSRRECLDIRENDQNVEVHRHSDPSNERLRGMFNHGVALSWGVEKTNPFREQLRRSLVSAERTRAGCPDKMNPNSAGLLRVVLRFIGSPLFLRTGHSSPSCSE